MCYRRRFSSLVFAVAILLSSRLLSAQSYDVLHSFSATEGSDPFGGLVSGQDGYFYGTTASGGTGQCIQGCGTVFRVDVAGNLTTLHSFSGGSEGYSPGPGLIRGADGRFYGMTESGGGGSCYQDFGCGTIFEIDSSGNLTTLHIFTGAGDAGGPAGLTQASDGAFYGTTNGGGGGSAGTIFKMDSSGLVTTLYTFGGYPNDGAHPWSALVEGTDGFLYGTTQDGGPDDEGSAFKVDRAGHLTILHFFTLADGGYPSGLVQGADGNFYGTTNHGGLGGGTVFRIDTSGNLTTLHSFAGADGEEPDGNLIQGNDGNFYGTTAWGGSGFGTVFKIDSSGNLMTLHDFSGSDGSHPHCTLLEDRGGILRGTTATGGANDQGVVFSIPEDAIASGPCPPGGPSLCLAGNRFLVNATWTKPDGESGQAHAVTMTPKSGYFWFFDPDNLELVVKVLDACSINAHYWVFSAGLTNLSVQLSVTDYATDTGFNFLYDSTGAAYPTQVDTTDFACAASPASATRETPAPSPPRLTSTSTPARERAETTRGCVGSDTDLCLAGRFRVEATWRTSSGMTGTGHAKTLTTDSGDFWFFDPDNIELVVKALDACTIDQSQWFFATGMTTLGVRITVTDTMTGDTKLYTNTPSGEVPGDAFVPILDTSAFHNCPGA